MVKYCKNCGSQLNDNSVYYDECGTKVGESSPLGNGLFQSYNIDMMDGKFVIRRFQIHEGCLILPAIILGLGIFFGLFNLFASLSWGYFYFCFS
ncbi:hypothetical protein [Methanobrevibacter sp.]|uniref:hypothetical protein n=1 Tax=Methanobrevibacter sp. TaxID=66852 RepID=UPI00386B77F3